MKTQRIIFANAECGPDELVVTFSRRGLHEVCSWTEFEEIGPEAMSAVVAAEWDCGGLQKLARSFKNREIRRLHTENSLSEMRKEAKRRKIGGSLCIKTDETSAFEWV